MGQLYMVKILLSWLRNFSNADLCFLIQTIDIQSKLDFNKKNYIGLFLDMD
jgi:hypothetical protein